MQNIVEDTLMDNRFNVSAAEAALKKRFSGTQLGAALETLRDVAEELLGEGANNFRRFVAAETRRPQRGCGRRIGAMAQR